MDPILSQMLEKYGPLGAACFFLCYALWLILTKLFPVIVDRLCAKIDALIAVFNKAVDGFHTRMDKHEETDTQRHGEVMTGIKEIKERLPEPKKGNDHAAG